jgi:hypothetical protein
MFLDLQIPLADARSFLAVDSNRLARPVWSNPRQNDEFVRGFGPIRARSRGGVLGLGFEANYCEAINAPRIPPSLATSGLKFNGTSLPLLCAFRRLLSNGRSVARMEIGFRQKHRVEGLSGSDCSPLWDSLLKMKVSIPNGKAPALAQPFGDIGQALAEYYLRSTTKIQNKALSHVEDWWVISGQPLIFMEFSPEEIRQPPRSSFQVRRFPDAGFTLHRDHISYRGRLIGVWLLELDSAKTFNLGLYRDLRIYLSRLHSERECFKEILRLVNRPTIRDALALQSKAFTTYVEHTLRLLMKRRYYGFEQKDVLEIAQEFDTLLAAGERDTIISELDVLGVGGAVLDQLKDLTKTPEQTISSVSNVYLSGNSKLEVNKPMGDVYKVRQAVAVGRSARVDS